MAARLLEASAAALVGGRSALPADRPDRLDLPARPAGGGALLLRGLAAGARADRSAARLDRRAGSGGRAFLQFLGRKVRPRPGAIPALALHRAVLLSRAGARAHAGLDAGGGRSSRRGSGGDT